MELLPAVTDRDEFDALVVRTDYSDDVAWRAVTAALGEPYGDGEFESSVHIVDDPIWAGASVDDVLAAVSADESLSVVFLADRTTMMADHHALLAVTTATRERLDHDEWYEALTQFGRDFRTTAQGVHDIHVNLHLANMDFEEFAGMANQDPEGLYRPF